MANQFGFSMNEDFLRGYADYLQQLREANPGNVYKVTILVGLIPDGTGYEMSVPPRVVIEEDTAEVALSDLSDAQSAPMEENQEITIGTPEEAHAVAMSLSDADIERLEEEFEETH
jgi:hypothetical protein